MKRAFGIGAVTVLILLATLLHSSHIKHFLWTHPWWHSFFVALPAVILAVLDLLHRREANKLSSDANALHAEANTLQLRNDTLVAELDAERNKQLQQIARNTERSITRADRNANILRRHLGEKVAVSEEHGTWPGTPQIVEVGDDYIFTLFTPHGQSSSSAHLIQAHCEDVEVVEAPQGACPLHLKVLKRYGPVVELGEITKWEDRSQPSATPTFAKGRVAYYAMYAKPGSTETRGLYVYAANDGSNSFLLEASTGQRVIGNNEEVSKRFMVMQVEYELAGFGHATSANEGSPHRLFVHVSP